MAGLLVEESHHSPPFFPFLPSSPSLISRGATGENMLKRGFSKRRRLPSSRKVPQLSRWSAAEQHSWFLIAVSCHLSSLEFLGIAVTDKSPFSVSTEQMEPNPPSSGLFKDGPRWNALGRGACLSWVFPLPPVHHGMAVLEEKTTTPSPLLENSSSLRDTERLGSFVVLPPLPTRFL